MYHIKRGLFPNMITNIRSALRFSRFSTTPSTCNKDDKDKNKADEKETYDIIITGGGMIGSALAAAIGHNSILRNKRVLLLESGDKAIISTAPEHFSSACCALSHSTKELLSSFGAWQKLLRHQEVNHMRVWDSASDVGISFNLDSLSHSSSSSSPLSWLLPSAASLSSLSELAYIAENNLILSSITQALAHTEVEVRYNANVKNYILPPPDAGANDQAAVRDGNDLPGDGNDGKEAYPTVVLEDGTKVKAKLLVGADGWRSLLRRSANIKSIGWPYKQTAVVAVVKVDEDRGNNTAWQRFLKTGPIALLPLSDDHSCLIWTTTEHQSRQLLHLDAQAFVNHVNHAYCDDQEVNETVSRVSHTLQDILVSTGLGQRSTKILPPTVTGVLEASRQAFPLTLHHANHYVKHRIALIGDAAHRVHPLSGQGVNLGFGDVTCLVEALQEGALLGMDVGSLSTLATYERSRQARVVAMMASIDLCNKCYSNHLSPLVLARSLACQVADSVPFVKERMIQFAVS